MSKSKAIKNITNIFTGGKGTTDLGKIMSRTTNDGKTPVNTKNIRSALNNPGVHAAVTGGGIGLGLLGIGAGAAGAANVASDGFKNAFQLQDNNGDGLPDNGIGGAVSTVTSWIIIILIGFAIVALIKYATKGGKK